MDADFFLIQKMKNGDEEAIERFVRKYYPVILRYCRYHTCADGFAEDLTQETFEHFFRSFASYRHSGRLANYLYVIAGNLCRDGGKKRQELPLAGSEEIGENPLEKVDCRLDVEAAVKRLPEELQEAVILYYFQNLKQKEVAEILGIGLSLVKYRLEKAKSLLRCEIGEEESGCQ